MVYKNRYYKIKMIEGYNYTNMETYEYMLQVSQYTQMIKIRLFDSMEGTDEYKFSVYIKTPKDKLYINPTFEEWLENKNKNK